MIQALFIAAVLVPLGGLFALGFVLYDQKMHRRGK